MKPDGTWEGARLVAEFCARAEIFADWPGKILFAYCFFHLAQGTCFTCRRRGRISGVMFAWQTSRVLMLDRARRAEPVFQWRISDRAGDALFVAEVVARSGERGARSLKHLMGLAAARWPAWEAMRIFTFRRNQVHELRVPDLKRLLGN